MSKFSKILSGTAVALTLFAGIGQASAALITEWGFVVQSGFSAFNPAAPNQNAVPNDTTNNGVVGSAPNGNLGGLPTVLSWGQGGNGPSQLFVTPTVGNPPSLFTNGGSVAGASLTHANNAISGDSLTLQNARLVSTLMLTPINPAGAAIGPFPIAFDILFKETTNFPDSGSCTPGTGGTPCADIFVLQDPGALTFDFILDEFVYTVTLAAAGLGPLSDEACAAAGEDPGCIGFITQEGENNVLQTSFQIAARAVPEPGTLALLGLGLLGLGVVRRCKTS